MRREPRAVVRAAWGLLVLWEVAALLLRLPILPPPHLVFRVLVRDLPHNLGLHLLASLWRVVVSVALAVFTAAPLGIFLGQSRPLDRLFSPFIYLLYPIPKVVFVPVVLLFLGVGDVAKIAVIYAILFFQVLVLVRDSAVAIHPELILSVRSLGAGRRALFRYVYLPASVPAILTAVRQSVGTAIAVLYIAELFATRWGLGYYIYLQGSTLFDYPAMYAGIVLMSLLGLGLYFAVDALEGRLCPWRE